MCKSYKYKSQVSRVTTWVVIVVLICTLISIMPGCSNACGKKHNGSEQVGSARKPELPGSPETARTTSPLAEPVYQGRRLIYPEVKAKAIALGSDVSRILRFVSQELGYEAYEGAMRGPRGVLAAGAGNSVDKSLLLRDLLRLALPGAETRFAVGTLSDQQAGELVAADLARRPPSLLPASLSNAGANTGTADPETRAIGSRLAEGWRTLVTLAQREAKALEGTLRQKGVLPPPAGLSREQLLVAARRHVWLQQKNGETWLDLDPTLGAPDKRRCEPDQTFLELPEGLYHHLAINVRLETNAGGKFSQRYLVETFWRAAELVGSTITYGHVEPLGLEHLLPGGGGPAAAAGTSRYTPLLVIDDEFLLGEPFTLPTPKTAVAPSFTAAVGGAFGRMGDVLGGAGNPAPDAGTPEAAGDTTGLFLEFIFRSPDGRQQLVERPIFDRVGYAARVYEDEKIALEPLEEVDGDYAALSTIWSVATLTGGPDPTVILPQSPDTTDFRAAFESVSGFHRQYGVMREALARNMQASATRIPHVTAPGVSLLSASLVPADADANAEMLRLDLLRDRVRFAPDGAGSGPADGVLWQVASLFAERALLATPDVATGEAQPFAEDTLGPDVGFVFAAARRNGVPVLLLQPKGSQGAGAVDASDEARARIAVHLQEGRSILVPARAVQIGGESVIGWWVVDPREGTLEDEMENGSHQAIVERGVMEKDDAKKAAAARKQRRLRDALCGSVFILNALAATQGGDATKLLEIIAKAGKPTKQLQDCKSKRPKFKKPRGIKPRGNPPPKPRGDPPRKPRPNPPTKKELPPQGKDRYGWGPKNPSGTTKPPLYRFH